VAKVKPAMPPPGPVAGRRARASARKAGGGAAQPGRADGLAFVLLALLLAAATAWLVAREWSPEYRRYQDEFRVQVRQRFGADAARSVPSGIEQVWIPQVGAANRCVTCHLATTWRGFESAP
jgi:hypothetical protein